MRLMKRFIVISLLAAATLPSLACAWLDTGNYYLFSPYDVTEFRERTYDTMMANTIGSMPTRPSRLPVGRATS